MNALRTELLHSIRSLLRAPGFSLLVIFTLGPAMAANLSVFSLLDGLVLRPLPVERPSELVIANIPPIPTGGPSSSSNQVLPGGRILWSASYAQYLAFRDLNVFHGMAAHYQRPATLSTGSDGGQVKVVLATSNYFGVLGVKASLGRPLTPDDDRAEGPAVVVLSQGFWQRQFGSEPSIVNRTIRLNQMPMTIVGVAGPGFTGTIAGEAPDAFVPLRMAGIFVRRPGFRYDAPGYRYYTLIARLAPGIDIAEAERATDHLYQQLLAEAIRNAPPLTAKDRRRLASYHATLLPGGYAFSQQSAFSRDLQTPLTLLMAMVGVVLFVAAANVANLILAREDGRSREVAICYALGAKRSRILRERLFTSLLLSFAAAILGLLMASWSSRLAPVVLNVDRLPSGVSSAPDQRGGTLAAALALATGFGIWAAGALRATRRSSVPSLVEHAGVGGSPRVLHWRRGMVVAQVALSLVLLCGSLVLWRSLLRLMSIDPGFVANNLYSFSVDPSQSGYDGDRVTAYLQQVLEQLRGVPGVGSASMTTRLPLSGSAATYVIGDRDPSDSEGLLAEAPAIGPEYFRTLGVKVIAGREFTEQDTSMSPKVAVVNESLARALFRDEDPLGRRVGFPGRPPDLQVVGVVKDMKSETLRASFSPAVFLPRLQGQGSSSMAFVMRTVGHTVTSDAVRAALNRIDPSVPIVDFESVAGQVDRSLFRDRTMASLSLCFAGLASLLCAMGVFGLTRFSVSRRTSEIAVRLALGARRSSIHWLVMKEVLLLGVAGCAIGAAAFITSSHVLSSFLFEIAPTDPLSVALAVPILGTVTLAAGFLPAYHAARQDPARTLRNE
jgi:predicted permease